MTLKSLERGAAHALLAAIALLAAGRTVASRGDGERPAAIAVDPRFDPAVATPAALAAAPPDGASAEPAEVDADAIASATIEALRIAQPATAPRAAMTLTIVFEEAAPSDAAVAPPRAVHLEHHRAPAAPRHANGRSLATERIARHEVADRQLPLAIAAEIGDRLEVGGDAWLDQRFLVDRALLRTARLVVPLVPRTLLTGTVAPLSSDRRDLVAELTIRSERDPAAEWRQRIEGAFALAPPFAPPWTIAVQSEGFAPSERRGVDGRAPLRIELARPTALVGTVRAVDGTPLVGVAIRCGRLGVLPVDERVLAHSDADGGFSLVDVPLAPIVLSAHREGYAPTRRETSLEELRSGRFDLVLEPQVRFVGQVVDPEGRPIAGAEMTIGSLTDHLVVGSLTSDARGGFDMPWIAADRLYHVEVRAPGFAPLDAGPFRAPDESIEIGLEPLRELVIAVVDADGRPISDANVAARPLPPLREHEAHDLASAGVVTVRSDARGLARLRALLPTEQRLLVSAAGYLPHAGRLPTGDTGAGDGNAPRRVTLQRSREQRIRIVAPDGAPLAGVRVVPALLSQHGGWLPHPLASTALTDSQGVVALDGADDRPGSFLADRPDGARARFELDAASEPLWRWPECGALEIELDGELVARAGALHLLVDRADGSELALRPGADGRCWLPHQPIGALRVRLLDEWLSSTWHTYAAQERSTRIERDATCRLRFSADGTSRVRGRVVASRDTIASGVRIVATRATARLANPVHCASLELDGRFTLVGLEPGRWRIVAVAAGAHALAVASEEVQLGEGSEKEVELTIPTAAVSLELRAVPSLAPLARATIELLDGAGAVLARGASAEDGAFAWAGELDEPLRAVARAPGFRARPLSLAEVARGGRIALEPLEPPVARARVQVIDALGAPLAGLAVTLERSGAPLRADEPQVALTNEAGGAEFTAPPGCFVVSCAGVSLEVEIAAEGATALTLRVERR
ncbi:MAG: carboxypeptidase regulatory-like domain-containing protein [Planctomycetes bacterium]|nr:carboxypeptidase regulatory-like domain-containing protein [Planctomycetota bacterium]